MVKILVGLATIVLVLFLHSLCKVSSECTKWEEENNRKER